MPKRSSGFKKSPSRVLTWNTDTVDRSEMTSGVGGSEATNDASWSEAPEEVLEIDPVTPAPRPLRDFVDNELRQLRENKDDADATYYDPEWD